MESGPPPPLDDYAPTILRTVDITVDIAFLARASTPLNFKELAVTVAYHAEALPTSVTRPSSSFSLCRQRPSISPLYYEALRSPISLRRQHYRMQPACCLPV